MFRIGIISDTHGLLRPEAERALTGVDHIIHAGDIGRPEIVDALRRIAPVTAIRGNVDSGAWAREYPDTNLVRLAGKSIYILHDLKTLQSIPAPTSPVVSPLTIFAVGAAAIERQHQSGAQRDLQGPRACAIC